MSQKSFDPILMQQQRRRHESLQVLRRETFGANGELQVSRGLEPPSERRLAPSVAHPIRR
eukprot:1641119-Pyramimonas_sp.AAC.1